MGGSDQYAVGGILDDQPGTRLPSVRIPDRLWDHDLAFA
jgi:hypothetical protein